MDGFFIQWGVEYWTVLKVNLKTFLKKKNYIEF